MPQVSIDHIVKSVYPCPIFSCTQTQRNGQVKHFLRKTHLGQPSYIIQTIRLTLLKCKYKTISLINALQWLLIACGLKLHILNMADQVLSTCL